MQRKACSQRQCANSPAIGRRITTGQVEARLNALPQFTTNIDGLDIHFIHVRSNDAHSLSLIVTHGWPGSIIDQLKIVEPLTNPTADGASVSDAFDIVIPSLPGHGFSGKPTATGWDPIRIARAWIVLMKRLGYTRFVAQGISGALDAEGRPVAWSHRFAGSSVAARYLPGWFRDGPDSDSTEGAIDLVYALPNMRVEYVRVEPQGIPTAFWRSVGPSHNVFVTESFIDELAAATKQDAVAYRRGVDGPGAARESRPRARRGTGGLGTAAA